MPPVDSSWGEHLGDVVVLARRPSATTPGTVDIDLDGFVDVHDRTDAVPSPDDVGGFELLGSDGVSFGACRDVTGVFREQAEPPVPRVRLLGCQPEALLLTALDAVGRRRHRIRAEVSAVAMDGSVGRVLGAVVSGTVASVEPSRFGAGLLDVTIDSDPLEPLPARVPDVLAQWRGGPPSRKNLWAGYDRELRH
ncbi:MAG TPA: hypothetical protein VNO31_07780, partial [Umezawaea sp.]|nr:hypothetical protein [Umezawaea sp.]